MHREKGLKKVCFITPGHISTNPRLVKEAIALSKHNFKVHIIFTQYTIRQIGEDYAILNANPEITFDVLNWSKNSIQSVIRKLLSGFRQKTSKKLIRIFPFLMFKNCIINRNYKWQLNKAIFQKADLYVAHNLPALPIAVHASIKNKTKVGFDAEDFHRFETSDDKLNKDVALKILYEEKYMPQTDYITAASPLIANAYEEIIKKKPLVILNVFPLAIRISNQPSNKIKLFWFSQTIGPNRGLETIIKSLGILKKFNLELNLLGEINDNYKESINELLKKSGLKTDKLIFHETISPDIIPNFAQQFDIGLASETSFSINNKCALSNKIFTYCQTGLAIVASDTDAQQKLLTENPGFGLLYKQNDANSLANILYRLCSSKQELEQAKILSYNYARTKFNWEIERKKFISLVNSLWVK